MISQPGFCKRSCEFPVFRRHNVTQKTCQETAAISIPCCSSGETLPSMCWCNQQKKMSLLNNTIQPFLFEPTISTNIKRPERELIFLCGEKNDEIIALCGMGKVLMSYVREPVSASRKKVLRALRRAKLSFEIIEVKVFFFSLISENWDCNYRFQIKTGIFLWMQNENCQK